MSADVPMLETERLRLRGWRDEDLDPFAEISADPEVMRFMMGGPVDRGGTAAIIARLQQHWAQRGFGHWAVEERESGALIGRLGLHHHDDWPLDPDNVEVGWLLRRDRWGRGLATEGARAALHFGFEEVGAPEIISITAPGNHASRRVMEKLGMRYAGEARWRRWTCVYYVTAGLDK